MTERQTSPQSFEPIRPSSIAPENELISEDDLNMINEGARQSPVIDNFEATAARRIIEVPTRETIQVPPRSEGQPSQNVEPRPSRLAKAGVGIAAGAALLVGVGAIHESAGGSDTPERGELDQTVNSIVLNPDANLRNDPTTEGVNGPNLVANPGQEVTIVPEGDVRVVETDNNGTWYGLQAEDLATQVPGVTAANDKDGVIWVNEQGVSSIDRDETAES